MPRWERNRNRGTHLLGSCRKVKAKMGEDRERQGLGNIPLLVSVCGVLWASWTIQAKKSGIWYALWGSYLRVQSGTPWEMAGLFIMRAIRGSTSGTSPGVPLAQTVKNLPIMGETWVWSLGRSPEGGNGNPLQYSCLKNSMERGVSEVAVHGIAKSWTRLSD